jgi:hypothetical protein
MGLGRADQFTVYKKRRLDNIAPKCSLKSPVVQALTHRKRVTLFTVTRAALFTIIDRKTRPIYHI